MSKYNLTELCKEDGVMSYNFTYSLKWNKGKGS